MTPITSGSYLNNNFNFFIENIDNRSNSSIAPILFVIIQSKILVYGISLSNKSIYLPDF